VAARIQAFDVARAIALIGMVIVNYHVTMSYDQPGGWGIPAGLLSGRAAALFVILAGIGTSLASERALAAPGHSLSAHRRGLLRRAAFLWFAGWAFFIVWPADILHYYGVFLLVGAAALRASSKALIVLAVIAVATSSIFLLCGDYVAHWDLLALEYQHLWTVDGFMRNLLLNGFHPVFPWVGFFLVGMALGRLDWNAQRTRRLCVAWGAFLFLIAKTGAVAAGATLSPMPPTPFFIVGGIGTALMSIGASFLLVQHLPSALRQRLSATGRFAFTHYLAHVLVGLGVVEEFWGLGPHTPQFSLLAALAYATLAVEVSWQWQKRWGAGPVERFFRKVTS